MIYDWEDIPPNPDSMRSLLGITVFISEAWATHYKRISSVLRKWGVKSPKEYLDIIYDQEALDALRDLREYA